VPAHLALPVNLAGWLEYIEALHPKSIAMGLERVNDVKLRLNLFPTFPIIIVAGTNGKGSTCAMLEQIYHNAGYRVACYTSPHLLRYNERVRIDCQDASDSDLSQAFSAVEVARQDTELTYFEYGTLAAMWHFMQSEVDIAILEVGLGGRLDAVNVFEPSCAIVTSIDLDHIEYLGNSRESIGFEKAGVFRPNVPAICGDINPPQSLTEYAQKIGAELKAIRRDFNFELTGDNWVYHSLQKNIANLSLPALIGDFQLYNAACVVAAIESLQSRLPVQFEHLVSGLQTVRLLGRFQFCATTPPVILDVAHNPHAAQSLASNLKHSSHGGHTLAVFAMLADKDIAGVIKAVGDEISSWYVASIDNPRGAQARQLADMISAYRQACLDAGENDRIIVLGSFFTVADVMRLLPLQSMVLPAAIPTK
jgi:dihydrofolate synthase/folylpolyglutamate synthase